MLCNVITTQALLPISRISGYSYHNWPKIRVIPQGYHALLIWSHRKILYYDAISQTPYPWSNYKKNQTQTDDSLQDTWRVLFNPVSHGKKRMTEMLFYNRGDEGTQRLHARRHREGAWGISETPSLEVRLLFHKCERFLTLWHPRHPTTQVCNFPLVMHFLALYVYGNYCKPVYYLICLFYNIGNWT